MSLWTDVSPLAGVIIGGGVSAWTSTLLYRRQRRDTIDAERRARDAAATSRLQETLASLLALEDEPGESREIQEDRCRRSGKSLNDLPPEPEQAEVDSWNRRHEDLVLAFQTASMDISDDILRKRLTRVLHVLEYPSVSWDIIRQPESTARRVVCRHALECVGASRRGDPLPPEEGNFLATADTVDDWIGWQEEQIQLEKEELARRRASRSSQPPEEVLDE